MGYLSMVWTLLKLRKYAKYLPLAKVLLALVQGSIAWFKAARSENSPGGTDVTAEEVVGLGRLMTDALREGTSGKYNVTIEVEE